MDLHSTRDVIQNLKSFIHGRVLDAGGGTEAKYKSIIASAADEYTCLDMKEGGDVDVVGDVLNMPFSDIEFDTVVCNQVLEHVSDPELLVAETFRVLKHGGHCIFTAPFLEPAHSDPYDFFRYTVDSLDILFSKHGFKIIEKGKYGGLWMVLFSFIKFSFFDPYKKSTKNSRRILRYLERLFRWFDGFIKPDRIYLDCYIVAQKL